MTDKLDRRFLQTTKYVSTITSVTPYEKIYVNNKLIITIDVLRRFAARLGVVLVLTLIN